MKFICGFIFLSMSATAFGFTDNSCGGALLATCKVKYKNTIQALHIENACTTSIVFARKGPKGPIKISSHKFDTQGSYDGVPTDFIESIEIEYQTEDDKMNNRLGIHRIPMLPFLQNLSITRNFYRAVFKGLELTCYRRTLIDFGAYYIHK